ncbi:TonB-dependent siderophore receptor [Chitinophaga sp. 22620]|uniref:TonB-dependent siderophore receptor n=1 Tax=Chitinophaga sp. 22620 TaxID=3453952 RepID=UPI003F8661AE
MKRLYIIFPVFLLMGMPAIVEAAGISHACAYTQNGVITGRITTSDGQPAEFATVLLNNKTVVQVDKAGTYRIGELPAGTYTITVRFAGQQTQARTITLQDGETVTADFALQISAKALNEVVIVGDKYTVTAKKRSNTASRLPLEYLENPQVYNVVDKELIAEQMALTLEESFRNIPGAAPAKTGAGMPAFFSRGFLTTDNLRNGMATYLRTGIDLVSVERVETVKGPSSTLFGGTLVSYGGLVNYVTKKPYEKFGGEVNFMTGSYELNRLTADINAPVNAQKTVLFRINMAAQNKNDWQDQGHGSTLVIAPSLTYKVSDRLTLRLDADMQNYKGTSNTGWAVNSGVTLKSFDQLPLEYKRSLIDNSFIGHQYSRNVFAQAEYKLSSKWTSQTNYAWANGEYTDLLYFNQSWIRNDSIQRALGVFSPDKVGRRHIQQNFTGEFNTGSLRHRLLIGADFMSQYRNYKYASLILDTVNVLSATIRDVKVQKAEEMLARLSTPPIMSRQNAYGAYFSDVINITGNLLVMASLRLDYFENKGTTNNLSRATTGAFDQLALSPKFGIVYQPVKEKIALFANYMNGFKNEGDVLQPDGTTISLKPQQAEQIEGGVKLDLLNNKLSATISYYDISVSRIRRTQEINGQNFIVQDGTQESKGVEAEVIGNPFPGFNFVAGYGYNKNKYTKSNKDVLGKRVIGTPEHVGNVWLSYSLLNGSLKGLGIGAGVMYVSDAFYNATNTFSMPAYTVVDATLYYNQPRFRLSVKASNITNEHYWISDGFYSRPQPPVNFLAGIAYKF